MKKSICAFLFKLLISVAILVFMIEKAGISQIVSIIGKVNLFLLLLALFVYAVNFILGGLNIKLLLDQLTEDIGFADVMRYHMLSWSLGLFVPGKIGEFSIMYFLKKHKISIGDGLVISIIDKIMTIVVLLFFSIFGFFIFFEYHSALNMAIVSVIIIIIAITAMFSGFCRELIKKLILRKYASVFTGFSKTLFYYFKEKKGILIWNGFITFLKLIVSCIAMVILFKALGSDVALINVVLIAAITTIISLIPISISGLGVREASAVYLFGILGVKSDVTLSVYLIFLLINYSIAMLSVISFKNKSLEKK